MINKISTKNNNFYQKKAVAIFVSNLARFIIYLKYLLMITYKVNNGLSYKGYL